MSTWKLAAGGLQRKWKGIKQRTAWRFKTLKDKNTLIVFPTDRQKEKEIHIKVRILYTENIFSVVALTLNAYAYTCKASQSPA